MAPASANNYLSSSVAPLSMSPQESGIIHVPFSVLNAMFNKAGLLIFRGQQAIVAAPGMNANPQHLVENETAPASPHIVTSKSRNVADFTMNVLQIAFPLRPMAYAPMSWL